MPAPLAVACHDAGAASLIIAWLGAYAGAVRPCVDGPAAALWSHAFPAAITCSIDRALKGARAVLTGTGWASDLEHLARKRAREQGIRSVAVIDHWVNYRERFTRRDEVILPDEIWVSVDEARTLASRCFPELPVRQLPNLHLEQLLRAVAACGPRPARETPRHILYVNEPIREEWGADPRPGEEQAFEFFVEYLAGLGLARDVHICLRPHPSDAPGKYDDWPRRYPTLDMVVDSTRPLPEQIARADWVAGCESFALVIAMKAGRIVLSTLPPHAPACRLPQRELRHLRHLVRSAI